MYSISSSSNMLQGITQSIALCQMNAKMLFQELEVPHLEKGTPSSELISPCAERVTPDVQGLLANPLLYPLVEEEGV